MLILSEEHARALVKASDAIGVIEETFAAMARGQARNYPVVREVVGYQDAVFGVKTGADCAQPLLGLKAGGYWPHNAAKGLGNHQSGTLLFDPETGRAKALVSANYLTGVRTGAASAIAAKHLSRADSTVLGMVGTGVQATYQLQAMLAVRTIRRVRAWDPQADSLRAFGRIVTQLGLAFEPQPGPRQVAEEADVLVTVTPSQQPLIEHGWLRPGAHVCAMGADTKGKQELATEVVAKAAVFVDEPGQAISIGECQHAFGAGLLTLAGLRTLGDVVAGKCAGRQSEQEITLFDGTGVALQDLAVAELAVRLATRHGVGAKVQF
ncbi:MAG: ornithine cyclodeaminase [Ramlibacter sp.]|nr:ornithine cyclodeaminase [Ramlibacter sp.]